MQRIDRIVDMVLAVIIVAIVAGLFLRTGSGSREQVITAGNAPGMKVELLSLRRILGNMIQVRLRTLLSADLVSKRDDDRLSLTKPRMDFGNSMYGEISDDGRVSTTTSTFEVPSYTRRVSIANKIITKRPTDRVSFDFNNVTPAMLPIVRKIGDTRVTLKSLNYDKEVGTEWEPWMYTSGSVSLPQAYFGVEVDVQSEAWAPELVIARFIDAKGSHKMVAECFHPTAIEVPLPNGEWGVDKTAPDDQMRDSFRAGNGRRMYLYNPLSEYPKRFTFSLRLKVPPDKADQRVVEFKDMQVR